MSRIGKKPIPLPSGVKIQIGEQLEVTGPKGKLTVPIPPGITQAMVFGLTGLPLALIEARIIRRKTPVPLDPELVREKETMLAELREVRERTLAFMDETKTRDLSVYCWPHPFLGTLNTYAWFQMIAAHELRHEKQMREIAEHLQKRVEVLHI